MTDKYPKGNIIKLNLIMGKDIPPITTKTAIDYYNSDDQELSLVCKNIKALRRFFRYSARSNQLYIDEDKNKYLRCIINELPDIKTFGIRWGPVEIVFETISKTNLPLPKVSTQEIEEITSKTKQLNILEHPTTKLKPSTQSAVETVTRSTPTEITVMLMPGFTLKKDFIH